MSSNKLIFNTIVVISVLFISCSPKVQSYRILVVNPDEQVKRDFWDHNKSETNEHNDIKQPQDGACLAGSCMEDDNAAQIKNELSPKDDADSRIYVQSRSNAKPNKLGGLKVVRTYDHNGPRIVYWPIFEN
ncbi:unnamed protein product [Spodoptera littoralis]|uniref:Lipoprotein n=1 Tax=Spodoptera littoralis TaxID=7109 RepID=A0A9P0I8J9_SPOLI|nr:unnamed protein product [Spodoptera littoralis]